MFQEIAGKRKRVLTDRRHMFVRLYLLRLFVWELGLPVDKLWHTFVPSFSDFRDYQSHKQLITNVLDPAVLFTCLNDVET